MVCMFLRVVLFCIACCLYGQEPGTPEQDSILNDLSAHLSCPIDSNPSQYTVYESSDGDILVHEQLDGTRKILQPDYVQLEYDTTIENPLKGKHISQIRCLQKKPMMVTKEEPHTLFMMEHIVSDSQQVLIKTEPIHDAQGHKGEIVAIGGTGSSKSGIIVVGVKPQGGIFGHEGSGLAFVKCSHKIYIDDESQGEDKMDTWIDADDFIVDPHDPNRLKIRRKKSYAHMLDASTMQAGNKAYAMDISHEVLSINKGLKELGEHLCVTFDEYGRCFYMGFDIYTREDATDSQGACSLAIGRIGPNGFYLEPAFADTALPEFMSAYGPNSRATVFSITPFDSSTKARYLIINGGYGEPEMSKRLVYAFPVAGQVQLQGKLYQSKYRLLNAVNMPNSKRATLASRNFYYDKSGQQDQKACWVGEGLLPGPATSIMTVNDAIVATVCSDETESGGIYCSHPIFDGTGAICAWTPWQRLAGIQNSSERILSFSPLGISVSVGDDPVAQTVKRVEWSKKHHDDETEQQLVHVVSKLFNPKLGGITHLNSVGHSDYEVSSANTFMVATGYNTVVFAETGANIDGHYRLYPNRYETIIESFNGTIHGTTPEQENPVMVTVSGGALQELGSITNSTFVCDGDNVWLVISGPKGIAVLADERGYGWKNSEAVGRHFANLEGFAFKELGSFKFVQRVFADNEYLYVLTDKALVRIILTPETIIKDRLNTFICAQADKTIGSFYECGISGPLCLLGTSKGIFCNGIGTDIRLDDPLEWHYVPLSQQPGMAYNFSYKTITGNDNDFGRGGQVYVQYGSRYDDFTHIYRFYINDVYTHGIREDSVVRLADTIINSEVKPYCSFYNFRSHFMVNCFDFSCFSGSPHTPGYVQAFQIKNNIGRVLRPSKGTTLPMKTKKIRAINACMHDKATGNWYIAGDFGMRVFGL